jgi:cytochrome c oxidase cbb3-type subunit 3
MNVAILVFTTFTVSSSPGQSPPAMGAKSDSVSGQLTFTSICAGCHGLDGSGSERAPSIAHNPKVQHLSDAQIAGIISNGVPGTGMPSFRSLGAAQIRGVASYVRALQGKTADRALPGDAKRGREVFFGKGECSTCHAVRGEGGFFGPDLVIYASNTRANAMLDAIVHPAPRAQLGYRAAAVITAAGERLEGLVRNEDNFSLQLLTQDGTFHFLQKSDLEELVYLKRSFMPANYGERLSRSELEDLVSFLISQSGKSSPARISEE